MIINDTIGNYLIIAGVILIFFFRRFNGKYQFILFLAGIVLIVIRFTMNEILVLKSNSEHETLLTFGSSYDYTFKNGNSCIIPISDNTLINDTQDNLVIEKLEYSTYSSIGSGENSKTYLQPFSYQKLENSVDYFYAEPPKTISVKTFNLGAN